MTSPGRQPQTPGAQAAPGGRMSPGRSPCASGWIALLFCARVRRERARSRLRLMAKDGEGGDGSGRGSAPQLQRLPREAGVGVGRERLRLRRQAALSSPLATGVFALRTRNSESADLGSSHQGLPASHCKAAPRPGSASTSPQPPRRRCLWGFPSDASYPRSFSTSLPLPLRYLKSLVTSSDI